VSVRRNGHHASTVNDDRPVGMPVLLDVQGLDVSYGAVQVLFDVSLQVRTGETVALLGTNGAGKSTLLKAVSGLLSPRRGTITFSDNDITDWSTDRRVNCGITQVLGGHAVFPGLSVGENLRLGAFTFLKDRSRVAEQTDGVVQLFPLLSERMDQSAGSLSGGEQQMLALAMALLPKPRFLVIDELSLGLAPIVVERLLQVIEDLKSSGLTMLIVEQSLNIALSFADRAVFMEKGEIRFTGDPQDLMDNGDLVRAVFFGDRRTG
jgi:ABC-type branched-subunit amino acid transport system ATPase component